MINRVLFAIAVIVSVALQTGCRLDVPSSAEPVLLRCLHAEKIVRVIEVRKRSIDDFDYIGVTLTLEVTWGFESWYHTAVILRKPHSTRDWSQTDLFSCEYFSISQAFELSQSEFLRHLHAWPCDKGRP